MLLSEATAANNANTKVYFWPRPAGYLQPNQLVEWLKQECLLSKHEALSLNPSAAKNQLKHTL
jgi:hypothetical protein